MRAVPTRPPAIVTVLLVVAACDAPAPEPEPPVPCPTADWPELDLPAPAGTRSFAHTYALPWDGASRSIDVHLWYPTTETDGEAARWLEIFPDPASLVGASFDPPDDRCLLPLVVWSHGSQAWGGNGSDLMRPFARAGYVVAAPDHRGNTIDDNQDPRPAIYPLVRVEDVRASIDLVESLPESDPLYGRVDTSRVLVVGHSFGGQTSWLISGPTVDAAGADAQCQGGVPCTQAERSAYDADFSDSRIAAVAPLAGDVSAELVPESGWADVDVPILYQTGSEDFDGTPMFQRAAATDLRWVAIDGACHESFTSTDMTCATLDKEEGLGIVHEYLQAFASTHVLGTTDGRAAAILDGSESISPRATLQSSR